MAKKQMEKNAWVGEVAQQLVIPAALTEDLSLVPSTYMAGSLALRGCCTF